MKRLILFVFLVSPFFSQSQKQGNKWYFGDQIGLDFNSGVPVILTGGATGTDVQPGYQEGTASISDSAGALLFYTSGKTIWNRVHLPMPNGTGIMGGTSSTQAALIVSKPGSDSLFYVFTSDEFQSYPNSKGYRYSVVDMCLSNGNGAVVSNQKNILLMDSCTEKLAACIDQAGTGYWILGHKMFSNEFRAWHLTVSGLTNTVSSYIGTVHGWRSATSTYWAPAAQGQMKISPQANKIALAISNFDPGYVDFFDFNNSTGVVSNPCHMVIDSAIGGRAYGIEFSPDGSKLYVAGSGGPGNRIYQYNLLSGSCPSVYGSQAIVTQSNSGVSFGLQLATNNRIYALFNSYYNLACINYPNQSAANCLYTPNAITLNYHYGLPSFIAGFQYKNKLVNCDPDYTGLTNFAASEHFITLFPNPAVNEINISCQAVIEEIVIRDNLSRVVFSANPAKKELAIKIEKQGIYFVSCKSQGMTIVNKLIIQP